MTTLTAQKTPNGVYNVAVPGLADIDRSFIIDATFGTDVANIEIIGGDDFEDVTSNGIFAGATRMFDWGNRAALVTAIANGLLPETGKLYVAGLEIYVGSPGATAIGDLPGLLSTNGIGRHGVYGWGQTGNTQTDVALNSAVEAGVHQFAASDPDTPIPTGGPVLVIRYSHSWLTQLVFDPNSSSIHQRRTQDNGASWGTWSTV